MIIDESDKITDEQLSQINLDKIEAEHEMQDEQLEKQLSQVDVECIIHELQPGDNPHCILDPVPDEQMHINVTKT